jgi:predicted CoA-binding protein
MNDFISKGFTYAVIGASNNQEKYGYKVFKYLHESGYNVVPVNLKESEIQGVTAYKSVLDYPTKIDVVFVVIPPESTESF